MNGKDAIFIAAIVTILTRKEHGLALLPYHYRADANN